MGNEQLSGDRAQQSRHKLRQGVAALLAPTMLEGVQLSRVKAQEERLLQPPERYKLLLETTTACIQAPATRDRSRERYEQDEMIQAAFPNVHALGVFLEHSAENLINPAVIDGQWVAMSAEGFLVQTDPALSPAEIIPRSVGLLAITRVRDTAVKTLHQELGLPIAPKYFSLADPTEHSGPTVTFTDEALAVMEQYPSQMHGCPAYTLPDPSGQAPNLLTAYWQQTTDYAFSGSALL